MEKITIGNDYLEKLKAKKPTDRSERAAVIREFTEHLNTERGEYKPLSAAFVSMKMSHLDMWDLKAFLEDCKRAKHFSKYWWYALKVKE